MKKLLRQFVGKFHTISRVYSEGNRLTNFLKKEKIDTIFDVGANIGQYAKALRRFGFKGKIISFEPLEKEKNLLDIEMADDYNFESLNYALGNKNKTLKINVAQNSVSSSILKTHERHLNYDKKTISKEKKKIKMRKLDYFANKIKKNRTMLKLDTQGFEYEALSSAKNIIKDFKLIQLELSFQEMYYKEKNWLKTLDFLQNKGFYVIDIFYGIRHKKNLELMQSDFILKRK